MSCCGGSKDSQLPFNERFEQLCAERRISIPATLLVALRPTSKVLKEIHAKNCDLTDSVIQILSDCIKTDKNLLKVDLSNNLFGDQGAASLAAAFANHPCIVEIDVRGNKLTATGAMAILRCGTGHRSLRSIQVDSPVPDTPRTYAAPITSIPASVPRSQPSPTPSSHSQHQQQILQLPGHADDSIRIPESNSRTVSPVSSTARSSTVAASENLVVIAKQSTPTATISATDVVLDVSASEHISPSTSPLMREPRHFVPASTLSPLSVDSRITSPVQSQETAAQLSASYEASLEREMASPPVVSPVKESLIAQLQRQPAVPAQHQRTPSEPSVFTAPGETDRFSINTESHAGHTTDNEDGTDARDNPVDISQLLPETDNLVLCDLSGAGLRSVQGVEGFMEIQTLILANNEIERMKCFPVNLRHLDLSYNRISSIDGLDLLTSLTTLKLAHNEIRRIEGFRVNAKLKVLDLSYNKIKMVRNVETLKGLQELNLEYNGIQNIDGLSGLSPLRKLIHLNLVGNPVSSLMNYRNAVIRVAPLLETLDGSSVEDISPKIGARESSPPPVPRSLAKVGSVVAMYIKQEGPQRRNSEKFSATAVLPASQSNASLSRRGSTTTPIKRSNSISGGSRFNLRADSPERRSSVHEETPYEMSRSLNSNPALHAARTSELPVSKSQSPMRARPSSLMSAPASDARTVSPTRVKSQGRLGQLKATPGAPDSPPISPIMLPEDRTTSSSVKPVVNIVAIEKDVDEELNAVKLGLRSLVQNSSKQYTPEKVVEFRKLLEEASLLSPYTLPASVKEQAVSGSNGAQQILRQAERLDITKATLTKLINLMEAEPYGSAKVENYLGRIRQSGILDDES